MGYFNDGPFVHTKLVKLGDVTSTVPKTKKEFDGTNKKKIEKIFKAKNLLICRIGPDDIPGSQLVKL